MRRNTLLIGALWIRLTAFKFGKRNVKWGYVKKNPFSTLFYMLVKQVLKAKKSGHIKGFVLINLK
jgi:hypothetical protein